jgi:hypothetical protein
MDIHGHHRCRDCGARVWVPTRIVPHPKRPGWHKLVLREDEFMQAFRRHVLLNPEKHPTYAIASTAD